MAFLIILSSLAFAESRYQRFSPKGREYTLVFMSESEFDAFILQKCNHNNAYSKIYGGKVILGVTVTLRKRTSIYDDPKIWWEGLGNSKTIPYKWVVYIPVDGNNQYQSSTLEHEIYHHVDNDIRHPIN